MSLSWRNVLRSRFDMWSHENKSSLNKSRGKINRIQRRYRKLVTLSPPFSWRYFILFWCSQSKKRTCSLFYIIFKLKTAQLLCEKDSTFLWTTSLPVKCYYEGKLNFEIYAIFHWCLFWMLILSCNSLEKYVHIRLYNKVIECVTVTLWLLNKR